MNKITPQDIQRGVESVTASPESTWYKTVETLDNGDELCFAVGMGEGFDEPTVCAKLGVLAGNSAMSDYSWDFVMPWNLGEGGNDVWDTEVSNPGESDAEWFNTQAEEIIRGFENGTIGTSLVGSSRKTGKKKPVKSSRKPIQSMYVTQDISGNDLYTCLWSGGKDQFDSMIEDGADADDILNACEELLFREEGNPPTMTELNDLIWFEPDTIREYIGLTNPIESGCHGKSKKDKKKKKAVKSGRIVSAREEVETLRDTIRQDINDLLYKYQDTLGITTGDSWTTEDAAVDNLITILDEQMELKDRAAKKPVKSSRRPVKSGRKAVKSAMQISEIHNNTSNLYAKIVYCDLESDVPEFNEEELIPIYDFKEQCKGYAETTNGWFSVSHDNSYEPGEYIVTFTNQEGENNEFESDPYFENDLGYVKFELVCDAGEELCNYLNE